MARPKKKPAAKTLKQTSKDYRLIDRKTEKMPVKLSQKERDSAAIHLAELVKEKEKLSDEKREVTREWRVKLSAKQEEIDDCAQGVLHGAIPKPFTIETRAIYKTRMIERVRTEDATVIEKRPMTPEEEVKYLQRDLDNKRAQPASLKREPSIVEPTEDEEKDLLDDGEREALGGLPKGWRKAWASGKWTVEGAKQPLTGADLWEVYLRIESTGSTTEQIVAKAEPIGLTLAHVQRALAILRRGGLVKAEDGGPWFVADEAPEASVEPGKNDSLPPAAKAKKPRRRRAKDTGEAAINKALGQSEGMEATA